MADQPVRGRTGGDVPAVALAVTVATWTLLYVAAMPPGRPAVWWGAAAAIAACLAFGGYALGRWAGRGWRGGAGFGAAVGAVSLIVLASLIGRGDGALASAAAWIGGFTAAAVLLGAAGAAVGSARPALSPQCNWTAILAWVTAAATLLMIVAGGIVTGLEAGLAVEGWLVAEGHLLVLFPIALMQRDVGTFVEHAHRLWGLLVGLSTIILAVHLWRADRRTWIRWLSAAVVLAVIVQGVLGGTRVTERSVALAVAHGFFAQVILAVIAVMASACSDAWRAPPVLRPWVSTDRTAGLLMLAAVSLQVILGTLFRHLQPDPGVPRGVIMGLLHGHSFIGSVLVLVAVLFCGLRAWGLYRDAPVVRRLGVALIHTVALQVLLGLGSFIVVPKGPRAPSEHIGMIEVVLTTAHQAVGAILLAEALLLVVWVRRK